ncbi:MAG: hypothetical protein QM778_15720 [Myxococcales bacterium]
MTALTPVRHQKRQLERPSILENSRSYGASVLEGAARRRHADEMSASTIIELSKTPVHLGLGAIVRIQEPFTGDLEWYERYGKRNQKDGVEGRLVSLHSFSEPWDTWEMHPKGEELVLCVAGQITLLQEIAGEVRQCTLGPGQAAINEAGVWHTADVSMPATALFITAGVGTEIRPR